MQIWLIQNGNKTGPFQDYEIRNRISDGQIDPDQFAWHEGLAGWVKLQEIEIFRDDLERAKHESTENQEVIKPFDHIDTPVVVPLSGKRYLGRRFWARWLDLTIYTAVWWLLMYAAGRDIGAMILNPWIYFLIYIPWFAIEAFLIYRFGTTLGKWLLGIRVVNDDDTPLTLKSSMVRSLLVYMAGLGFGWGGLTILCQAISWFVTRVVGKPLWDQMGKHKISVLPMKAFRIITLIVLFFTAMQLQVAVKGPHEQEIIIKQFPELKELFEKSKPFYFPVKN